MSDRIRVLGLELKAAHADTNEAIARLLAYQRRGLSSMSELHAALSALGAALQRATTAQRELALVLALDPDRLASQEPLVEPLIEHEEL